MNKNGSIDPTISELIYDENVGTPNEWDWSAITGTWDLSSTTIVYSGSFSIDGTLTVDNDLIEGSPSSQFDLSNYYTLVGYIYLTS